MRKPRQSRTVSCYSDVKCEELAGSREWWPSFSAPKGWPHGLKRGQCLIMQFIPRKSVRNMGNCQEKFHELWHSCPWQNNLPNTTIWIIRMRLQCGIICFLEKKLIANSVTTMFSTAIFFPFTWTVWVFCVLNLNDPDHDRANRHILVIFRLPATLTICNFNNSQTWRVRAEF